MERDRWIAALLLAAMPGALAWPLFPLPAIAWVLASFAIWLALPDRPAWQRASAVGLLWIPILGLIWLMGFVVGNGFERFLAGSLSLEGGLRAIVEGLGMLAVPMAAGLVAWHRGRHQWTVLPRVTLGSWLLVVTVLPFESGMRIGGSLVDIDPLVPVLLASLATVTLLTGLLIEPGDGSQGRRDGVASI